MWYVVQVRVGMEENIKLQCQKRVSSEVLERCFILYSEEKKKVQGKWVTQKHIVFSGYVFMITEKVDELFLQLKSVNGLSKLIGAGDDIVPLNEGEVALLRRLGGEEQVVISGSLEGMEGFIKKIDRHKRKAWLELEILGDLRRVEVGLEVVKKI
jgi:transcriptional antiterminator NusG